MIMKAKSERNILIFLLASLGLGAIGGGGTLIISPSGKLLGGLPLSMLERSPFTDFLVPGIILFFVLGVFPCLMVYALIKRPESKFAGYFNFYKDMYWAWSFSIYVAFALIIWIQIEMSFVQSVHWSHTLYIFWAIAIIFISLLPQVRNSYKK
jgi:hypothetical protein